MLEISLQEEAGLDRKREPVRVGVPFGRGELRDPAEWRLTGAAGEPVPFAAWPAAWWNDGSIKWLLADFAATVAAGAHAAYRLSPGPGATEPESFPVCVENGLPERLVVSTGGMEVTFARAGDAPLRIEVTAKAGRWELEPLGANLQAEERTWEVLPEDVDCRVEQASPQRAVVRLQGDLRLAGVRGEGRTEGEAELLARVICRVHCLAGADYLILDHTYVNIRDIRERRLRDAGVLVRLGSAASAEGGVGGQARFGIDGETRLRGVGAAEAGEGPRGIDVAARARPPDGRAADAVQCGCEARFGIDGGTRAVPVRTAEEGFRLFQTNADRPRPLLFNQFAPAVVGSAGYASDGPTGEVEGEKLDGWAAWRQGATQLTVAVEDLWQQYPKEIVLGEVTAIKLWARDRVAPGELDIDWRAGVRAEDISPTGARWRSFGEDGVAKTHRVLIGLHPASVATEHEARARAFQSPLLPRVSPERYLTTGVLGPLAPARPEPFPRTERFLQRLTEWIWRHQREWSNWYGMLNWGGIQTHYLPVEERWTNLIERFGWINGETEPQLGVLYQYVRTGDDRWLRLGRAMVRHLVDVDAVQAGERTGLMRRHFAVHFGQPGDMSHTFLGAPCLLYCLTGDERVREVIEQVADQSRRHFAESYERDSTDAMKNCLYYYELSGEEPFRERAGRILDGALSAVTEDGGVGLPHDTGFHTNYYLLSALLLWARVVGPDRIREDLARIMDYEIAARGRSDDPGVSRGASYEGLAAAYLLTGDDRYLYPGIKDLAALCFTNVYQTYEPTRRFPSGNTEYYRPVTGATEPDSYASVHWLGRALTMIPPFLEALHTAGLSEDNLPIDGGIAGSRSPFVRQEGARPAGADLGWDAPDRDYPGERAEAVATARRTERHRFVPLSLDPVWNRNPLAADPFGYDAAATAFPQILEAAEHAAMGSVQDNLEGLPWGAEAILGGVPFQLPPCAGPGDPGLLLLERGETWALPVAMPAQRLHFLGHVAAGGGMQMGAVGALYRIRYTDGSDEEIQLRNLVDYEDWRYLHYARAAPLACAWYPRAFSMVPADAEALAAVELDYFQSQVVREDAGVQHRETPFGHPLIEVPSGPRAGAYYWFAHRLRRSRHLNLYTVDTHGRDVAAIELQDAGEGHQVLVLAVTAERPADPTTAGRAARLCFPGGRPCRAADGSDLPLELVAWEHQPETAPPADGALFSGHTGLRLRTGAGRCYVVLTLCGGPVMVSVRADGRPVVAGYHLLGNWCRDWPDPVQRIGFEVEAPTGEIELDVEVDPGLLYERSLNHLGGNGWVWRPSDRQWERRAPEPWQLLAVEAERID